MAPEMDKGTNEHAVAGLATELLAAMRVRDAQIKQEKDRQFVPVLTGLAKSRTEIREATGIDPAGIAWKQFGVRKLRESVHRVYRAHRVREATAETAFGQLLRYGVQNFLFDAYQNVPTVAQAIYETRPSTNRQEWYAPLYGAEVPEDVAEEGHFDDSRIKGLDVMIINKKVGRILSISRELVDDDQTGQIVNRATRLGERMRYKEELDAVKAIVLEAKDYSTGGSGSTPYTTAIGNKFTAGSQPLIMQTLEEAAIELAKIVDPLGNFMLVLPDTVFAGRNNEINLYKLLNSAYMPAIPGAGVTSPFEGGWAQSASAENIGDAKSGSTGWTLTINWLQGRYTPVISTFFDHPDLLAATASASPKFWFLMQAKKGAVWQERDPLEVIQENPLSGASFETDAYRYRVRRRYKHAVIEPRFIFQGYGNF